MDGNEETMVCEYELNCSNGLEEIMSKIDFSEIKLNWDICDKTDYLHEEQIGKLDANLDVKISIIGPLVEYLGCAVTIESFLYDPAFLEEKSTDCRNMYDALSGIFSPEKVPLELYLEADLYDVKANAGYFSQSVSGDLYWFESGGFDSGYFFLEKEQFKNTLNKYLERYV